LDRIYFRDVKLSLFLHSVSVLKDKKMKSDITLLKRAIKIAGDGIIEGCGPFGAVITKDGKVIAESNNMVILSHDPTAHAEVLAIRKASSVLKSHDLSECTVYTSCEPCPMCLGAIYWAGIKRVVYASDRHAAADSGFSDKLIYDEIILDPSARQVAFEHIQSAGSDEVFIKWNNFEGKIPY
jgi:guanine deaminase